MQRVRLVSWLWQWLVVVKNHEESTEGLSKKDGKINCVEKPSKSKFTLLFILFIYSRALFRFVGLFPGLLYFHTLMSRPISMTNHGILSRPLQLSCPTSTNPFQICFLRWIYHLYLNTLVYHSPLRFLYKCKNARTVSSRKTAPSMTQRLPRAIPHCWVVEMDCEWFAFWNPVQ